MSYDKKITPVRNYVNIHAWSLVPVRGGTVYAVRIPTYLLSDGGASRRLSSLPLLRIYTHPPYTSTLCSYVLVLNTLTSVISTFSLTLASYSLTHTHSRANFAYREMIKRNFK